MCHHAEIASCSVDSFSLTLHEDRLAVAEPRESGACASMGRTRKKFTMEGCRRDEAPNAQAAPKMRSGISLFPFFFESTMCHGRQVGSKTEERAPPPL